MTEQLREQCWTIAGRILFKFVFSINFKSIVKFDISFTIKNTLYRTYRIKYEKSWNTNNFENKDRWTVQNDHKKKKPIEPFRKKKDLDPISRRESKSQNVQTNFFSLCTKKYTSKNLAFRTDFITAAWIK